MGRPAMELTGKRFGRLLVLRRLPNACRRSLWECQCDCGTVTQVLGDALKIGTTRSCGCLRREAFISAVHRRRAAAAAKRTKDLAKALRNADRREVRAADRPKSWIGARDAASALADALGMPTARPPAVAGRVYKTPDDLAELTEA